MYFACCLGVEIIGHHEGYEQTPQKCDRALGTNWASSRIGSCSGVLLVWRRWWFTGPSASSPSPRFRIDSEPSHSIRGCWQLCFCVTICDGAEWHLITEDCEISCSTDRR